MKILIIFSFLVLLSCEITINQEIINCFKKCEKIGMKTIIKIDPLNGRIPKKYCVPKNE